MYPSSPSAVKQPVPWVCFRFFLLSGLTGGEVRGASFVGWGRESAGGRGDVPGVRWLSFRIHGELLRCSSRAPGRAARRLLSPPSASAAADVRLGEVEGWRSGLALLDAGSRRAIAPLRAPGCFCTQWNPGFPLTCRGGTWGPTQYFPDFNGGQMFGCRRLPEARCAGCFYFGIGRCRRRLKTHRHGRT